MGLLDELMGGGEQQGGFQDFVHRYEQGAPHEDIGEQETAQRYGQVAGQVDPGTYQQSAQEALGNMDPQQRADYGQQLSTAADQQGVEHGWDGWTDPQSLATTATRWLGQDLTGTPTSAITYDADPRNHPEVLRRPTAVVLGGVRGR